jgi:hypothetical protein
MAMVLGGVLLIGSGCGGDPEPAITAAPTIAATSAAPSASADYTADTKKVCGEFEKAFATDASGLAEELGKIVLYHQTGNRVLADKATAAAQQRLNTMAAKVEQTTAAAQDPDLRLAGQEAARNMRAAATDDEFFASLKNAKLDTPQQRSAFATKMQEEMSSWGTQLGAFCGP